MSIPLARAAAGLLLTAALAAAVSSCDQGNPEQTCAGKTIPTNACPTNEDDSECNDQCNCASAYSCIDGEWSLQHSCPGYDPAKYCIDAGVVSSSTPDASPCDAAFAVPTGANGGTSCIDLQPPDCPLGEVLTCGGNPCAQFGCESLFYCESGNWIFWGSCSEDAGVVQAGVVDSGAG
jgi:hypothetical protein